MNNIHKITFEDLNKFIQESVHELCEYEKVFHNQVIGQSEQIPCILRNRQRIKCLVEKCNALRFAQGSIDFSLDLIENLQNKWLEFLNNFEVKYHQDLCHAPVDQSRLELYGKVEEILSFLLNFGDEVGNLETKITGYNQTQFQEDSFYAFVKVMNDNLQLLENLFLHIEKLRKNAVLLDDVFRGFSREFNNCNC